MTVRRREAWIRAVALVVAVGVTALAVVQAIREGSLGPVWMLGWVPAVLAPAMAWSQRSNRCAARRWPGRRV
jgi:hypothetical protein